MARASTENPIASQVIHTIPPRLWAVSTIGPVLISASVLKLNPQGWHLQLTNAADWPTNGLDVVRLKIEVGHTIATLADDFVITLAGKPWTVSPMDATPTNTGIVRVTGGWNDGLTTRVARVTVNILQACTLGLVWSAL